LQGSSSRQFICARPAYGFTQGSSSHFKKQMWVPAALPHSGNLTAPVVRVIVGNIPQDAAVNPVTNKVYVSNSGDGMISVIIGANPTAPLSQ
jgi:hypothetical protein